MGIKNKIMAWHGGNIENLNDGLTYLSSDETIAQTYAEISRWNSRKERYVYFCELSYEKALLRHYTEDLTDIKLKTIPYDCIIIQLSEYGYMYIALNPKNQIKILGKYRVK